MLVRVCLDIAVLRDGCRKPLSRSSTRHGQPEPYSHSYLALEQLAATQRMLRRSLLLHGHQDPDGEDPHLARLPRCRPPGCVERRHSPAFLIDQLRYGFRRSQKGKRVQELAAPEEIPIYFAEFCLIAYSGPALLDRLDLFGCEQDGLGVAHQKQGCCFQAQRDLACTLLAHDQHGLRGFSTCPILRTDVIGRGQGQFLTAPECGVITRMVIGISAENVEQHSRKEFCQRLPWRLKPVTNDGRELLIAGIAGHELVELQQREGGNHGFSAPTSFHFYPIKAFDKEDVLSRCARKAHRG